MRSCAEEELRTRILEQLTYRIVIMMMKTPMNLPEARRTEGTDGRTDGLGPMFLSKLCKLNDN